MYILYEKEKENADDQEASQRTSTAIKQRTPYAVGIQRMCIHRIDRCKKDELKEI
jgi:hypothetical protein